MRTAGGMGSLLQCWRIPCSTRESTKETRLAHLAILPIGAERAAQDQCQEWRLRHPEDAPSARS